MNGFPPEQKQIILFRDFQICPMCYRKATIVNHRANRGSGGFEGANTLANGCAICWQCNDKIETDPEYAELARFRGVKISRYDDATTVEYFHPMFRMWTLLENGRGDYTFCDAPERTRIKSQSGTPGDLSIHPGHLIASPLPGKGETLMSSVAQTIHRAPAGDHGIMPCCGRTPFEVPQLDRITATGAITCGVAA